MNHNIDDIDKRTRKILGIGKDEELEYNTVVESYILVLANYATNLDDKTFFTPGIFHNLNYSLYHLTGWIFSNHYGFLTDEEITRRMEENELYKLIIEASNLVINRFLENGKESDANIVGAAFYVIANNIYDYEKSLENIDVKSLS